MGRSTKYTGAVAVIVSTMLDLPVDSEESNTLLRALEVLDPKRRKQTPGARGHATSSGPPLKV